MLTTMSIALNIRSAIQNKDYSSLSTNKLVQYYNTLSEHLMGCKKITHFHTVEQGVQEINDLINAVEARGQLTFCGDPEVNELENQRKKKRRKVGVKTRSGVGGLTVSVDGSRPTNMSKVKVSTFKKSEKIVLNREPSPAQRKHLENMGVWERTEIIPQELNG